MDQVKYLLLESAAINGIVFHFERNKSVVVSNSCYERIKACVEVV